MSWSFGLNTRKYFVLASTALAVLLSTFVVCGPNDLPDDPTNTTIEIDDSNFGNTLKNMDEKLAYLQSVREGYINAAANHKIISDCFQNKACDQIKLKQAILTVLRIVDYDSRITEADHTPLIKKIGMENHRAGVAAFANGAESWSGYSDVVQFAKKVNLSEVSFSLEKVGIMSKNLDHQIGAYRERFRSLLARAASLPEERRAPILEKLICSGACCMLGLIVK